MNRVIAVLLVGNVGSNATLVAGRRQPLLGKPGNSIDPLWAEAAQPIQFCLLSVLHLPELLGEAINGLQVEEHPARFLSHQRQPLAQSGPGGLRRRGCQPLSLRRATGRPC